MLLITCVFGRQAGCARQTRVWRGAVRDAHRYRGIDIPARLIASGAMHRRCFPATMRPPRHPCHAERANCRHPNNALPRICCELPLQDGNTRVIRNPGFHPGLMELALQAGIAEGQKDAMHLGSYSRVLRWCFRSLTVAARQGCLRWRAGLLRRGTIVVPDVLAVNKNTANPA